MIIKIVPKVCGQCEEPIVVRWRPSLTLGFVMRILHAPTLSRESKMAADFSVLWAHTCCILDGKGMTKQRGNPGAGIGTHD